MILEIKTQNIFCTVGCDDELQLVQNFWTSHADFLYYGVHKFQNFWNLHSIAVFLELTQNCCTIKYTVSEDAQNICMILEIKTQDIFCTVGLDDELHLVQNFWTSHTDFLYDGVHFFLEFLEYLHKTAVRCNTPYPEILEFSTVTHQ
jgi:hypothetical protein